MIMRYEKKVAVIRNDNGLPIDIFEIKEFSDMKNYENFKRETIINKKKHLKEIAEKEMILTRKLSELDKQIERQIMLITLQLIESDYDKGILDISEETFEMYKNSILVNNELHDTICEAYFKKAKGDYYEN